MNKALIVFAVVFALVAWMYGFFAAFIMFAVIAALVAFGFAILFRMSRQNQARLAGQNPAGLWTWFAGLTPDTSKTTFIVVLIGFGTFFLLMALFGVSSPEVGSVANRVTHSWLWLVIGLSLLIGSTYLVKEEYGKAMYPIIRLIGILMVIGWVYAGVTAGWDMVVAHNEHETKVTQKQQADSAKLAAQYAAREQRVCGTMGEPPCQMQGAETVMRYLQPGQRARVAINGPFTCDPFPTPDTYTMCKVSDLNDCYQAGQTFHANGVTAWFINTGKKTVPLSCGIDRS